MAQEVGWDKEYQNPLFVTKGEKPQNDVLRFLRFFKKQKERELAGLRILDLGSGTGRNANYLANMGNEVIGLEISPTAIELAKSRALDLGVVVTYLKQNIGTRFSNPNDFFDLVLDVTASNALSENERDIYMTEVARVLNAEGLFFVRALCKDGDKNAKKMLAAFPGRERDTYVMPGSRLVEKVFSEVDFRNLYGKYFRIVKLEKKSGYTKFGSQSYKRNYWLAYLAKK